MLASSDGKNNATKRSCLKLLQVNGAHVSRFYDDLKKDDIHDPALSNKVEQPLNPTISQAKLTSLLLLPFFCLDPIVDEVEEGDRRCSRRRRRRGESSFGPAQGLRAEGGERGLEEPKSVEFADGFFLSFQSHIAAPNSAAQILLSAKHLSYRRGPAGSVQKESSGGDTEENSNKI